MTEDSYQGREIAETGVDIAKTGHGLSEAMKAGNYRDLVVGDEGFIVLSYRVHGEKFEAVNRADPAEGTLRRVALLDAITATFVDDETVGQAIAAQEVLNLEHQAAMVRAKAEAKGQHQLDDWELTEAHDRGEHSDGLVAHCPACDRERALEEDDE